MGTALTESLSSAEFIAGLRWGLLATGLALPIGLIWLNRFGRPAPVHGLLAVAVFLMATPVVRPIDSRLWVAVLLLVLGGVLGFARWRSPVVAALLVLPGALWLVSRVDLPGERWIGWLTALVVVLGASLITSFDKLDSERAWGPALWLLTVGGVFAGVPDTEEALVLLGISVPMALLGWPFRLIRIGPGAPALLALFMWVVVWGGRGRPYTTMAVIAGLGMLLVEPIVRWLGKRTLRFDMTSTLGVVVLHLVMVLLASRWAARYASVPAAATAAVAILAVGGIGLAYLQWLLNRRPRR